MVVYYDIKYKGGVIVEKGAPQEIFVNPKEIRTQFLRRIIGDYDYSI
ncbi:hypothetical protein [Lederbergia citrea]